MLSQKVKSDAYMGACFGFILIVIASFYYDRFGANPAADFELAQWLLCADCCLLAGINERQLLAEGRR